MIKNEVAKLFDKLQKTDRQSTISQQGPLKSEYKSETFWTKVVKKEPVMIHDKQTIAAATKNMIAGVVLKENNAKIIDLVLRLAFYVMDGDDASFAYKGILTFVELNCDQGNRRKVNLEDNGWFEKWNRSQQTSEFCRYLQDPSNDECISYWGPWLATTILTLRHDNRTVMEIARSIDDLFSKLLCLYQGLGFTFPKVNAKFWKIYLNRIQIINLDEHKKNNLNWAAISVFHDENTPKLIVDLLNLTMIPSLRFNQMELITLIDQFSKVVGCGQCGALASSLSIGTFQSWKIYAEMTETYLNPKHPLGKDKLWPYTREFDPTVFLNLSYAENYKLCNILAMIIDLSKSSWYSYRGYNIGPTYAKLISKKPLKGLSQEEFEQCKTVYNRLKIKEREVAMSDNPTSTNMLTL